MQQVMPGLLSRTPTTSGALIPGSKRFASSLSGPGRAVLWDHKTCASMAEACSGLLQKRGAIGQLDPKTGAMRLWPIPSPAPGVPANPDSLIVTPNGQVWLVTMQAGR